MSHYIDGFVLPVPRKSIDDYRRLVEATAAIWKEHGAIDYREYIGDDLSAVQTGSFIDALGADQDEAIIFGWVVFESRETRDLANSRVSTDPRMTDLLNAYGGEFDARRMAYGGFQSFVTLAGDDQLQTA